MFFILFIIIGAVLGYVAAPRVRIEPMIGGGLGAVGGLIGGAVLKFLFPLILGLVGAALGALILIYGYKEYQKRS